MLYLFSLGMGAWHITICEKANNSLCEKGFGDSQRCLATKKNKAGEACKRIITPHHFVKSTVHDEPTLDRL